jgi:hypothetical protein
MRLPETKIKQANLHPVIEIRDSRYVNPSVTGRSACRCGMLFPLTS